MLDIASRFLDLRKHHFFFLTPYPEVLPYKRRYLQSLERQYGIAIDVFDDPASEGLPTRIAYERALEMQGTDLIGLGYHRCDSLQRRAICKKADEKGIVDSCRFFLPLIDWKPKQCFAYLKSRRLNVSPEYSLGANREFSVFTGIRACVLRHLISEEDFQCAARQDIRVKIDYERWIISDEWKKLVAGGDGRTDKP